MTMPARVIVAGSGVAAGMASVALARRLPDIGVTLFDPGLPLDPIDDLVGVARPSLRDFFRSTGIDEGDILTRTGSRVRLGSVIDGLSPRPFFRGHGELVKLNAHASIVQHWRRIHGEEPIETLSPAAMLAASGEAVSVTLLDMLGIAPGYFVEMDAFRAAMRGLGAAAGVEMVAGELARVALDPHETSVASLDLADGRSLAADIFVDATGGGAYIRRALPLMWQDWSALLPVTHLALADQAPSVGGAAAVDRLTAKSWGWCHLAGRQMTMGWAAGEGPPAACGPAFTIRQGCLENPFGGNVVAIGSAAVALEPFAGTALHLLCRQIDRLISLWAGARPTCEERRLLNRRALMEAARARDLVQAHYRLNQRAEPFWRRAAGAQPSEALARDIAAFTGRGNLHRHDEDGVVADEWAQLFIGLGAVPQRRSALAEAVPLPLARQLLEEAQTRIVRAMSAARASTIRSET